MPCQNRRYLSLVCSKRMSDDEVEYECELCLKFFGPKEIVEEHERTCPGLWTVANIRQGALDHHHQECWNRVGSKSFGFCHWIATMLAVANDTLPKPFLNDEDLLIYWLQMALTKSKAHIGVNQKRYAPTVDMIKSIEQAEAAALAERESHGYGWASAKEIQLIMKTHEARDRKQEIYIAQVKTRMKLNNKSSAPHWRTLIAFVDPLKGNKQQQLDKLQLWRRTIGKYRTWHLPIEPLEMLIAKLTNIIEIEKSNSKKRYNSFFKQKKFWYASRFDSLEDKDLAEIIIYSSVQRNDTDALNAKLHNVYFNIDEAKKDRVLSLADLYLQPQTPAKKKPAEKKKAAKATEEKDSVFLAETRDYGIHMEALGFVMLRRLAWLVYGTDNLWVQPLKHKGRSTDIVMATNPDMMLPVRTCPNAGDLAEFLDVIFAPQNLGRKSEAELKIASTIANDYRITMGETAEINESCWQSMHPNFPNLLNAVFYDTKWSVWNTKSSEGSSRWIIEMDSVQHAAEEAMGTDRSWSCGKRQIFAYNCGLFAKTVWNKLFKRIIRGGLTEKAVILLGKAVGITKITLDNLRVTPSDREPASLFWPDSTTDIPDDQITFVSKASQKASKDYSEDEDAIEAANVLRQGIEKRPLPPPGDVTHESSKSKTKMPVFPFSQLFNTISPSNRKRKSKKTPSIFGKKQIHPGVFHTANTARGIVTGITRRMKVQPSLHGAFSALKF